MIKQCEWTQEQECSDTWGAECGGLFRLDEGGPSLNKMKYCCYCGHEIKETWFVAEGEDE